MSGKQTKLHVTKQEFDTILYGAIAGPPPKDVRETRLIDDVLGKLDAVSLPRTDGQPGQTLIDDEKVFAFSNVESEFVLQRLEKAVESLQGWKAREVLPLIDQMQGKLNRIPEPESPPAAEAREQPVAAEQEEVVRGD